VIRRAQLISQLIATALARQKSNRERREVEDRLKMAVDAAGAGLWTLDDHTGAIWASPHARAMFGYPPGETINRQRFEASIHPDDRRIVNDALERSRRTGEAFAVEYRVIVSATNGVRWVASRGRPTVGSDAQGRRLMGISLDVTEQRLAAEELRANSARLQAGTDLAGLGFYVTDYRTGVMTCDDRFCDLLGIADAQRSYLETTRYWAARLHPEDRLAVLQARDRLHSGEAERVATEYRYSHPTRGEIWVDHLAAAVERDVDGRLLRNIGVVRDIGSQKRAELGMREMSQRLLKAQEQERALIARELHDDLSQRLAVLSIEAARAEGAADEGQAAALRSIREGLVRLSEDVHSLAYQLHPSVLEELGLAAALRAECERRARQGGPELSLAIEPLPDGIGNEAELCLFRVAQEALTNAIRHAGAGKLQLQLRLQGGGVLLAVCDDGLGFDVQQMTGRGRLGLASMRERMRIVNGTLDIESAPGSGTTVVAWAPLAGDAR
jgi:PAS domain S-box-containing protein